MKKSKMHEVTISADSPDRVDNLIAKHTDFSRSQIQHFLQQGAVLCNDRAIKKKGQVLAPGEYKISLYIEFEVDDYQIQESTLPVTVAFEDDFLMVINKSPGVSVHPGAGQKSNTLINALIGKIDRSGYAAENMRPGIVHRLDKDTSGLMIVAKKAEVAQKISEMLKLRQIERVYHSVVWGVPFPYSSTINMPITRSHNNRQLMAIATEGGRDAVTHYKVLHIFADHVASLLECRLETGRTHQIRVHLAAVGHGVVGDKSYGKKSKKRKAAQHLQLLAQFPRQALHSSMLTFLHPVTKKLISLEAPLPSDMNILLEQLHSNVPSTD